ncbi:MAG TPA: DNA polymerase III subunit gamma/tau [Candidatus Limnocylindrales bacterium]|nr:DNA polymerase III subunit gamma/tau [Candidatus Limnocylindrales bacterium]
MTTGTPHQALYRRWRAQTFSEIVGQEAVVATLRNAVATGRVSHALLFTGPRGTGKTSLARIVAKAVNCLDLASNADPCDRCTACTSIRDGVTLDVIEIDAASNRGIDSIRELRERINYPPGELRRKVYILDEAHQITKDAWNALLKSLEEPPDFVSFMFASTHPQGFPPAILSRLQRFDVRRLTVPEITGKLQRILAADGREADPEAVAVVARLAAGGMRDAESILDQLLSSTAGRIEADAVRDLLGLADADLVDGFTDALATGDAAAGIGLLDRLEERGRDLRVFLDQVVDALRERLLADLAGRGAADPAVAAAARRLAGIDPTRLGPGGLRLQLELALLEPSMLAASAQAPAVARTAVPTAAREQPAPPAPRTNPAQPDPITDPAAKVPRTKPASAPTTSETPDRAPAPAPAPSDPPPDPVQMPADVVPVAPLGPVGAADEAGVGDLDRLRRGWTSVVTTITERNRAVKPLITACRPIGVEGNVVTLGFPEEQGFLKDVADRRKPLLEECIGSYLGHDVGVRCIATNLDLVPPLPDDQEAERILAEAHRIFAEDRLDVPEVT